MSVKLLFFYMNGCGWCDKFKPTWGELKKKNTSYEFYECESNDLNGSKEASDIINKFGADALSGFPAIFAYINNIYHKYDGDRSYNDIITFVNKNGGNMRGDTPQKEQKKDYDIPTLCYFYMKKCRWCNEFNPVWDELEEKNEKNEIKYILKKYERSEMDKSPAKEMKQEIEEALDLKITSYPAIFIKVGEKYYKYNGTRTLKDILEFVAQIINNSVQNGGKIDYRNKYKKYKKMYCEILEKYNELNKLTNK